VLDEDLAFLRASAKNAQREGGRRTGNATVRAIEELHRAGLAVVGGIALLLGAIFFLSLAFSRGWITEPLRVLIGLVAGAGLLVLGELSFTRLRGALGHVLVAVGLAIIIAVYRTRETLNVDQVNLLKL